MANNTLEFIIKAKADEFMAAIRSAEAQAKDSFTGMSSAAKSGGDKMAAAFKTLDIRSFAAIKEDIRSTVSAYSTLAASGKLSGEELVRAAKAAKEKIAALNAEMKNAPQAPGSGLQSLAAAAAAANVPMSGLLRTIQSTPPHILAMAGAMAGGAAGAYAYKVALAEVIETGSKFATLGVQMKAVMGGEAEGRAATQWLVDFNKRTPYELADVTQAFVKLKNAGIDPMNGSLEGLSAAATRVGGGQENLQLILLAVTQMWAKGKITSEEMTRQLSERGIPAWDLLAKSTGKSVPELMKMAEAGTLGKDAVRGLIAEISKWGGSANADMMKTYAGQLSNVKDNWEIFKNAAAQSGPLEEVTKLLTMLNAVAGKSGEGLASLARNLGQTLSAPVTALAFWIEGFKSLDSATDGWMGTLIKLNPVVSALNGLFSPVKTSIERVSTLTLGLIPDFAALAEKKDEEYKASVKVLDALKLTKSTMAGLAAEGLGGSALSSSITQTTMALTLAQKELGQIKDADGIRTQTEYVSALLARLNTLKDSAAKVKDLFASRDDLQGQLKTLRDLQASIATAVTGAARVTAEEIKAATAAQLREKIESARKEVDTEKGKIDQIKAARQKLVDDDRLREAQAVEVEEKIAAAGITSQTRLLEIKREFANREIEGFNQVMDAAKKSASDMSAAKVTAAAKDSQIIQKELAERIAAAQGGYGAVRSALDRALGEYQKYANQVRTAEEKLKGIRAEQSAGAASAERELNTLRREGMTTGQAQADIQREIADSIQRAKTLGKTGSDKDVAAAKEQLSYAQSLNRSLGDRAAKETNIKDITSAQNAVLEKQAQATEKAKGEAEALKKEEESRAATLKDQLAAMAESLQKLSDSAKIAADMDITAASENLAILQDNFSQLNAAAKMKVTADTFTINTQLAEVERKIKEIAGLAAGVKIGGGAAGMSTGGPVGYQTGGPVRYASGGRLPGYGGGDRIPALLEAGEFIIRKEAVNHFGSEMFAAMNALRTDRAGFMAAVPRRRLTLPLIIQKFASGGPVSAQPVSAPPGGATSTTPGDSIRIDITMSGKAASVFAARDQARGFVDMLHELQRGTK
ncbi:tape measure protein [candidate division KSB1 bacterium]|nr:tape measure protein [candidate division KSB1 bacterium]